jgi:hypothetical protein
MLFRERKESKDRVIPIPEHGGEPLRAHLETVRNKTMRIFAKGTGTVGLLTSPQTTR